MIIEFLYWVGFALTAVLVASSMRDVGMSQISDMLGRGIIGILAGLVWPLLVPVLALGYVGKYVQAVRR